MDTKQMQILLLEDEAAHAEAIRRALESSDSALKVHIVSSLKEFRDYVAINPPDIALLDMVLPDGNGIDLLVSPLEGNAFPMLMLTSHGNEQTAVAALKTGALDYIVKSPETFADMPRILTRNLNQWTLIREKKEAEKALQVSEQNFSNSMDNSPLGIHIVSEDGETSYTNRAFLDIYGYKDLAEFKNIPVKDRYTPESYAEFHERRAKRLHGELLPDTYEVSIIRKDGLVRQLLVIRKEILWGGKQQYQTIYQDFTQRKQAEEALKASEERYRLIVENSNDIIFTFNAMGEFTYISPSVKKVLGYNPAEVIGHTFSSLVHPEDLRSLQQAIERNIKDGTQTPSGNECRIRDASGEWRWHNASGNAVFSANHQFVNFVGITRDITESKLMTIRINELNNVLQLVTDINQLIVKVDNEAELLQKACDRFVASRQFLLAWVGFKKEGSYDIIPAFQNGEGKNYLASTKFTWDDSPLGKGPTGIAIKTGKRTVIKDILHDPRYEPWREQALKMGFKSSVALPLVIQSKVIGVLNIYSASSEAFDDKELELLAEMAGDLSLGIEKIRQREEISAAQNALKESEHNFRNFLDNSSLGVCIRNSDDSVSYTNQAFLDIFGYKNAEESRIHPPQEYYSPESYAEYIQRRDKIARGEPASNKLEVDIIRKDGTVRRVQIFGHQVIWNGKLQAQTFYNDVTELKQTQDALKASEQNFRNSIEGSLIGIRIRDKNGKTLYVNQAFLNIFDYNSIDEVPSNPLIDHYTPEEKVRYLQRQEKRARDEQVTENFEVEIMNRDGTVKYVQTFLNDIYWNGQQAYQVIYNDITELKKTQVALKTSEQNFRNSIDASPLGIRVTDIDDNTLYLNQAFLDIFGYENIDEVRERPPLKDFYTPESYAGYLKRKERLLGGELRQQKVDVDIIRKDGALRHLQLSTGELFWDGKKEYQTIYTDITEKKQAEAALKISEQNFRNSMDSSSMGIRIMGDTDYSLYANQALLDIFGYKNMDELRASPPQEHYTPESYAGFIRRKEQFARGETLPEQLEFDIIRKDGAIRHLQLSSRNVFWNGKQQYQLLYNDITERKLAEEALKLSEQKYSTLIEKSSDGIVILDGNSIEFSNRRMCEITGYSQNEILGKNFLDLVVPEYIDSLKENYQGQRANGVKTETFEMEIISKDNKKIPIESSAQRIDYKNRPATMVTIRDITERKLTEEALKESETRYHELVDTITSGVLIYRAVNNGEDFVFIDVNSAAEKMEGINRKDIIGKKITEVLPGAKNYHWFSIFQRVWQTGNSEHFPSDEPYYKIAGRWQDNWTYKLPGGEIVNIYNDITERKQAQEALQASEQNFRNSMDNSSIGIRISDRLDNNLYANQAMLNIFSYENLNEIQAKPPQEFYTPECHADWVLRHEKLLRGEPMPEKIEIDIIRKDGTVRNLQVSMMDVFWNGKQQHQTLYNDVTEFKQAEKALRESEKNYQSIVENTRDVIFTLNERGEYIYVSPSVKTLLGYLPAEIKGKPFISLVYADDRHIIEEETRRSNLPGYQTTNDVEYRLLNAAGDLRWVVSKGTRVVDANGKFVHFIGIIRDITESKLAEAEKQQLEEKAQVASRLAAVGEMAAGIAHEINNPLTGVLGFSQMILERKNVPEEIKDELKLIADGSQRVADIVKRLLTFARQTKPVKTMTNINELIDNTLKLRNYVLKTANIEVVTRFDQELPWSVVDPGQMQQVFLNLIVNAEQAMKGAHGRGTLIITTEKKGNDIHISFQDDGPGIIPENMKRMFEPFFTTKAPGEGTGLGLSLSRSIVLGHNGKLSVDSEPGHGANFIIELPITDVMPPEDDALFTGEIEKPAPKRHGNVLAVDDEPGVRILLEKVLKQMGHSVDIVADAKTAMQKLDAGVTYDVILTDVRMAGISGIELYSHIIEKTPAMKSRIIFITGDVMGADIKNFFAQNKLTYLAKPFNIEALKEKVNSIMMTGQPGKYQTGKER